MTEAKMSYIALLPCGCLDIACCDTPEMSNEIARMFRYRLNRNYTIKHVPSSEVRSMAWECEEHGQKEYDGSLLDGRTWDEMPSLNEDGVE